ncbi:biotin synthase [Bacteroides cellulosilyticus DSM 14838]|uniref:Biotin synthase n=1 Tax=Bacteroides cellulosilyticus DSM 14838 TaxID=537012 RepID=E2N8B9_9BACE|nr:biotin synthase [Bacteroides cellulosilyticus DSM 14838]
MKLPSFKVNMIIPLIDKLRQEHRLSAEEYKALLLCQDADTLKYLQEQAREVSLEQFGNRVFIRGLIEITNHCRNNCYYCGIRKGNQSVLRYELTREDILECCREGYTPRFPDFRLARW